MFARAFRDLIKLPRNNRFVSLLSLNFASKKDPNQTTNSGKQILGASS